MNDQDYILKAAKLIGWDADEEGWLYPPRNEIWGNLPSHVYFDWPWVKDLIAAQLVRQVDALDDIRCDVDSRYSEVWDDGQQTLGKCIGDDRTMNTIKAIVDSKVLE